MRTWQAFKAHMRGAVEPSEAGIGLVLVLGYALVIGILLTVCATTVISVTKSGQSHIQYGQAVDSAEAGIDQTLARLAKNANYATSGVAVPSTWLNGFPDPATERTWVLNAVNSSLASDPSLLQKSAQGEFVAIRPSNAQSIYSVGWEPSRAKPVRTRVLRNDYLFSGYSPTNAIQTAGNINISGSFTLASNSGTALLPNVHSEGQVFSCNGSVTVPAGTTMAGVGGGCGGTEASQTIPRVDPRGMYDQLSSTYSAQWYDLCYSAGVATVRQAGASPCTGAPIGSTRGWNYNQYINTWTANSPQSGIYYAYQSDIDFTGAGGVYNVTLMAESVPAASGCPMYGNVHVKQTQIAPALPYVSIYAGGSVNLDSQSAAGDATHPGLVGAAQDISMTTSSSPGVVGAVIANNICGGSNTFKGSQLTFDANMTIRSADLIRSTLQIELT